MFICNGDNLNAGTAGLKILKTHLRKKVFIKTNMIIETMVHKIVLQEVVPALCKSNEL